MSNRKLDATFGTNDEGEWARRPIPEKAAPMTQADALRVLGWVVIYLTLGPPIAVILWRLALSWP